MTVSSENSAPPDPPVIYPPKAHTHFMKTAVIAPLGMSPPVITTFVDGIGEPVSDVVVLVPDNEKIRAGLGLLQTGLKLKFPWIRVHTEILPFSDIATEKENFQFMSRAAHIIRIERDKYKCDKIFLNVAGGRKNICITLALLGQILQTDGVFHITSHNIDVVNTTLERYRKEISGFLTAETEDECRTIYDRHREIFDHILFPERATYDIIRIPTLPFPTDYLQYLIYSLKSDINDLTGADRELLVVHGLLEKTGATYHITDHGRAILEVLLGR